MGRDLCKSSHPTLTEQGELKKGGQDCAKWTTEHLWGWRLHNFPGRLVPVLNHPYDKIDFTFKLNFFQSMSLTSSLFTGRCCEYPDCPSSLLPCHQVIIHNYEPSLLKTGKSQPSQPLFIPQMFQSFHHLFSLFLGSPTLISPVLLFLYPNQADVAWPLLSRGGTRPYNRLSNKFILHKIQQPARSWTVSTHECCSISRQMTNLKCLWPLPLWRTQTLYRAQGK